MPPDLTDRQQEYLDYIRTYIQKKDSAPRLDEIAKHFGVTSPTAHKALRTLQDKGQLYFGRDPITGFYIRVPEYIGTTERMSEIDILGKVNRYGEVVDFPKKLGHFPTIIAGSIPTNVLALEVWQHLPGASIQAGDMLILGGYVKPKPGDIGIMAFGEGWLLVRLYDLQIDPDRPYADLFEEPDADLKKLANGFDGHLAWWPLGHNAETDDYFAKATLEHQIRWLPISPADISAILIRVERPLTI